MTEQNNPAGLVAYRKVAKIERLVLEQTIKRESPAKQRRILDDYDRLIAESIEIIKQDNLFDYWETYCFHSTPAELLEEISTEKSKSFSDIILNEKVSKEAINFFTGGLKTQAIYLNSVEDYLDKVIAASSEGNFPALQAGLQKAKADIQTISTELEQFQQKASGGKGFLSKLTTMPQRFLSRLGAGSTQQYQLEGMYIQLVADAIANRRGLIGEAMDIMGDEKSFNIISESIGKEKTKLLMEVGNVASNLGSNPQGLWNAIVAYSDKIGNGQTVPMNIIHDLAKRFGTSDSVVGAGFRSYGPGIGSRLSNMKASAWWDAFRHPPAGATQPIVGATPMDPSTGTIQSITSGGHPIDPSAITGGSHPISAATGGGHPIDPSAVAGGSHPSIAGGAHHPGILDAGRNLVHQGGSWLANKWAALKGLGAKGLAALKGVGIKGLVGKGLGALGAAASSPAAIGGAALAGAGIAGKSLYSLMSRRGKLEKIFDFVKSLKNISNAVVKKPLATETVNRLISESEMFTEFFGFGKKEPEESAEPVAASPKGTKDLYQKVKIYAATLKKYVNVDALARELNTPEGALLLQKIKSIPTPKVPTERYA